jgi:hypothetical protein
MKKMPMKGVDTIIAPFSGKMSGLIELVNRSKVFNPFSFVIKPGSIVFRSPSSFVLSHKASPSNRIGYQGLVTDLHLLKYGTSKLGEVKGVTKE